METCDWQQIVKVVTVVDVTFFFAIARHRFLCSSSFFLLLRRRNSLQSTVNEDNAMNVYLLLNFQYACSDELAFSIEYEL